jgi:hypothetical protein
VMLWWSDVVRMCTCAEKERKENDIQRAASFSLVAMSRPTDFFIGLEFAG